MNIFKYSIPCKGYKALSTYEEYIEELSTYKGHTKQVCNDLVIPSSKIVYIQELIE